MANKQKEAGVKSKPPIELNWWWRIVIYGGAIVGAFLLIVCGFHKWLVCLIEWNGMGDWYIVSPNIVVATFLFAFIVSTAAWVIRTFDKRKEFYDSLKLRNDAIFAEFAKLVLSAESSTARAQGVLGLVRLKREHPDYESWVDAVTSTTNLDLRRAMLQNADLSGANLREVDLSGANLSETNLSEVNLRWANLSEYCVNDADQKPANMAWSISDGIKRLQRKEMANLIDLISTDLSGANLSKANISGANLESTVLCGTKLRETTGLAHATLTKAVYDDTTEFPDNFNPDEHGMKKTPTLPR